MRASDLSYSAKQQLLQEIRSKIGSDQYERAVDAVGEDGLVDFVLQQAMPDEHGQPTRKRKRVTTRVKDFMSSAIACVIALVVFFLIWYLWAILLEGADAAFAQGNILKGICLGGLFLAVFVVWLILQARS